MINKNVLLILLTIVLPYCVCTGQSNGELREVVCRLKLIPC